MFCPEKTAVASTSISMDAITKRLVNEFPFCRPLLKFAKIFQLS
jgi:hypothetical protein